MRLTYEEFVSRYCDGMQPTTTQGLAIKAMIGEPSGRNPFCIFQMRRGSGRSTLRLWLARYLADAEREESGEYHRFTISEREP